MVGDSTALFFDGYRPAAANISIVTTFAHYTNRSRQAFACLEQANDWVHFVRCYVDDYASHNFATTRGIADTTRAANAEPS